MNISERIAAFNRLGLRLQDFVNQYKSGQVSDLYEPLIQAVRLSFHKNGWFSEEAVLQAFEGIIVYLEEEELKKWTSNYSDIEPIEAKRIGIVMAGNIPLVGFHDLLSVLIAGHEAHVKMSSDDQILLPELLALFDERDHALVNKVHYVQQLKEVDAVIATGSNNSARYFETYFSKFPNIIRKNRTSIAVLDGSESEEELKELGSDIFSFYGLGCRNVTKIYIPQDFELNRLFSALVGFDKVMQNNKYMNNYTYNQTLYLMNNDSILDNNFIVLKEDEALISPIGTLFYERYQDIDKVKQQITKLSSNIQCVVGKDWIPFGMAQKPGLKDYADGVDTMNFLTSLN